MTPTALADKAASHQLAIFGHCQAEPEDGVGTGTLVLLGPREPGFWQAFTASDEWQDGRADPLDRWSERVVAALAEEAGGLPLFPFGETLHPFMRWAIRSGRAWSSPVHLLVHDVAGLMVSYRGAVLIPEIWADQPAKVRPCESCEAQPCRTACPVGALTPRQYTLDACHSYLDTPSGADCLSRGCAVRRSCPIAQSYGRIEAQSSYHMERFHK